MSELERSLSRLGREVYWPPTPDLAGPVAARIAAETPARPRPPLLRGLRRSLAVALVLLLVIVAAAVAALPGLRDGLLEVLGLQGATIERRVTLPTPPPERPLELGRRTTLASAAGELAFDPLLPRGLGAPDGVYVRRQAPGGELSLAYRARPGLPRTGSTRLGLLVTEFRGGYAPEYLGKAVGPDTRVRRLRVGGRRAVWIEGAPHFFFYRTPDERTAERELRLARNVLLLERGPLLIRLEGTFGLPRALELARSLR